ncbi:MAG: OsmC family protein [Bacteroidales bacterium]
MKSKSVLIDGYQSVIDNGRSHSVVVDLPKQSSGNDSGATALELTLMSLSGCISTIFKKVADRMRINIENLEVNMEADKGEETFDRVRYNVQVTSDAPTDKLKKCLELTEKSCPVGVLFSRAGVTIEGTISKNS